MGGRAVSWLSFVVGITCQACCVAAFICHPSTNDPCTCSTNKWMIDLFPVSSKFSVTIPGFYFQYHPCNSFQCSTTDKTFMLCMHVDADDTEYGIGRVTASTVWNVTSIDPLNFTITYYDGDKYDSRAVYSTVRVIYQESRINSKLKFIKSVLQGGNETELYEFEFLTTFLSIDNRTVSPAKTWIAGAVVGSWAGMVLLVTLVVLTVICIPVSSYKRKIKKDSYQRLNQAPEEPSTNQRT